MNIKINHLQYIIVHSNRKADIALIGLAVMGQNLILNMDQHGFVVCAYNRTVDKVHHLVPFQLYLSRWYRLRNDIGQIRINQIKKNTHNQTLDT